MSTAHPELFAALAAPFDPSEVKFRSQAGRQFHYITARTAMNRLDNVLGPENWWDDYTPGAESVICRLTVMLPDGRLLTKVDAGGYAGMADSGDDDKSGFSDAFKRACAKFGIARYLYRDGVPEFAQDQQPQAAQPAQRPAQVAPGRNGASRNGDGASHDTKAIDGRTQAFTGRSGKALFAWVKEQEQRHEISLLKYINGWAKLVDFPGRMVDWDEEMVAAAHVECQRKLGLIPPAAPVPSPTASPAPTQGDWNRFIADRVDRARKHWASEMAMANVPPDQRAHADFQMPSIHEATNHFVSHAIKTGALKNEDVAKDGKPGVRDPQKAKAAISRLYQQIPDRFRAAVDAYFAEKESALRVKLGMDDPAASDPDYDQGDEAEAVPVGREPGSDDDR